MCAINTDENIISSFCLSFFFQIDKVPNYSSLTQKIILTESHISQSGNKTFVWIM